MLWEMSDWLDTHVLPPPGEGEVPSATGPSAAGEPGAAGPVK